MTGSPQLRFLIEWQMIGQRLHRDRVPFLPSISMASCAGDRVMLRFEPRRSRPREPALIVNRQNLFPYRNRILMIRARLSRKATDDARRRPSSACPGPASPARPWPSHVGVINARCTFTPAGTIIIVSFPVRYVAPNCFRIAAFPRKDFAGHRPVRSRSSYRPAAIGRAAQRASMMRPAAYRSP
jgi:hypothetical protein